MNPFATARRDDEPAVEVGPASGNPARSDLFATRGGKAAVIALITLLFIALRVALLLARDPFFDELFTMWITRKSFGGILDALRNDSGPPLYYFAVRALGIGSVVGARLLSLACAAIALGVIVSTRSLGEARFTAAALLAVFPPAALFAVDARSYAMCAMFVTIAVVLVDRGGPFEAAIALAAAAYCHDYGVLFFPIVFVQGEARRIPLFQRAAAFVFACGLFLPGFGLALAQPRAATAWMGFPPSWPDALIAAPPAALLVALGALTVLALVRWAPARGRPAIGRFTWMTVIPIAMAVAFALVRRPVYFPLRFESVLAAPLVLAIGTSLDSWPSPARRAVTAALLAGFLAITGLGIAEQAQREPDDYRAAAGWVARNVPAGTPLVADGYLYLETVMAGRADAIAYPAEQKEHPGWRTATSRQPLPPAPFVWVGERGAEEFRLLRAARKVEPLYVNRRAIVARVP